jgi:hypothetical protein
MQSHIHDFYRSHLCRPIDLIWTCSSEKGQSIKENLVPFFPNLFLPGISSSHSLNKKAKDTNIRGCFGKKTTLMQTSVEPMVCALAAN